MGIEFEEADEDWELYELVIKDKLEYDLARCQALKILEIADIPEYYKNRYSKIIYDPMLNEEYPEIENIIVKELLDSTEINVLRHNLFSTLEKINDEKVKKEILTKLFSDEEFKEDVMNDLKLL